MLSEMQKKCGKLLVAALVLAAVARGTGDVHTDLIASIVGMDEVASSEFAVVRAEAGDSAYLRISIYRLQDGKILREHRVAYTPGPGPLGGFAGVNHQDGRTVLETSQDGRSLLYVFDGAEEEPRQYAAEITTGLTRLFSPHSWLYWERSSWGAVGWLDVRHEDLVRQIGDRLIAKPESSIRAKGEFRPGPPSRLRRVGLHDVEVRWTPNSTVKKEPNKSTENSE